MKYLIFSQKKEVFDNFSNFGKPVEIVNSQMNLAKTS